MRQIPLEASATVTLDGSGSGVAQIMPSVVEKWTIDTVSVSTSSAVKMPLARLFLGQGITQADYIDQSVTGAGDVSRALSGREVPNGYKISVWWTGGDAGALATVILRGTKMVR